MLKHFQVQMNDYYISNRPLLVGCINRIAYPIQYWLFSLLLTGCFSSQRSLVKLEGRTMGTTFKVLYISEENSPRPNVISGLVRKELNDVNKSMSTYMKDSEISQINRHQKVDWISVSRQFLAVLEEAKNVYEKSEGAFDVTLGPLVNLWGFGPSKKREVPSQIEVKKALQNIGFDKLDLDFKTFKLRKKNPNINLRFSKFNFSCKYSFSGISLSFINFFALS